jgi:hypothetical protein
VRTKPLSRLMNLFEVSRGARVAQASQRVAQPGAIGEDLLGECATGFWHSGQHRLRQLEVTELVLVRKPHVRSAAAYAFR